MLIVKPHHIIAIGASAGGTEEINSFFDHTPLDGVSYIIIQHLSPDFKSRMVELLARHSKLIVEQAENGMVVKCNQVYLIPSDKYMTIRKGTLYLTDKENIKGPHLTINKFFSSLAADFGKNAIGIVLSGLGLDGTEGIKAIKKAGGIVIARDPENTEFGSMPSHAIATGMVDFVLEPALMPGAIEEYVKHEGELIPDDRDDEKNLEGIIELIKSVSPLDFTDYKQPTILRRTKRRASYGNFTSLANYLKFLMVAPHEVEALSKEFLISVTSFFRDPEAFDLIETQVLPDIIKHLSPDEELKMWVTGCATGEEAYSMAILIDEQLTGRLEDTVVKIFATDIDSTALIYAGRGVYNSGIVKTVSPERLEKYFIKEGDTYRVIPAIRKMLIFAQHDLVKNPPYCNMHLISCRNLLIYMAPVLQKKIFTMLLFGLKRDGYLFLGSSENPIPIIKNLEVVNKKWKIYKNLETKRGISFDAFSLPELLDTKRTPSRFTQESLSKNTNTVAEAMQESLAGNLGYFAVCIDENYHVIKSYGNAAKYLLQKHFTSNLQLLLPKPLAVAFSTLSKKAIKTNEPATRRGIKIKQGKHVTSISLSVSPLTVKGEANLLIVTFSEDKKAGALQKDSPFDEKIYLDQYVVSLEEEIKELKDKLNSSKEKLNAYSENIQSFNEELISANEEMQSTNEEMQSVNEELHTINSDYQLKNKELVEINDDLNNYFRSNVNGQLFIDDDLLLMKFSPGTVKQINLLESDIGRPLSNISTNIKFETIIDDIKKVLAEGAVITKEIETTNGKWYQIMTMPYVQQADQKRNGAIITFNDITELKSIQQELDISNKMLNLAIDAASMGVASINIQTREFVPTRRLKELFSFNADEQMSYEAAIKQIESAYRSVVKKAIRATIKEGGKCDVEFPITGFHDKKLRWIKGVGNLSYDNDGNPGYFTGVLQDITIHKQDELRKNDFIGMVSHELRTPLTSIQAYVQMLAARAKKGDDEFSLNALNKANIQVKKMITLINGFLNLSSFEAGKIYLNEQTFDMNGLVDEIAEDFQLTTSSHNIRVSPGLTVSVHGDRDKIGQVITNLINNAIKYSPNGKTITLSCIESDALVKVCVADEGMGVSRLDQERLFDRYFRIENSQTQNIAGFGLGLYLSAEIIRHHKGNIWVESEIGKGASFYFSLPVAALVTN